MSGQDERLLGLIVRLDSLSGDRIISEDDVLLVLRRVNDELSKGEAKLSQTIQQHIYQSLMAALLRIQQEVHISNDNARMTINCLGNLLQSNTKCSKDYSQLYSALLAYISQSKTLNWKSEDTRSRVMLVSSSLRTLSILLTISKSTLVLSDLRELLSVSKISMFYDIDNKENDVSWRVRVHGAELLQVLGKIRDAKKLIWSAQNSSLLFPVASFKQIDPFELNETISSPKLIHSRLSSHNPLQSFYQVITHDPSERVRVAAIFALLHLLDGSKGILAMADDKKIETPFVSLAQQLGSAIQQIHFALLFCLFRLSMAEHSVEYTEALLKCLAILLTNCPFKRLSNGYLTSISILLLKLQQESNSPIILVNVLQCFSAFFSTTDAPEPEIITILCSEKSGEHICQKFIRIAQGDESISLRVHALTCLASIAGSYKEHISYFPEISEVITEILQLQVTPAIAPLFVETLKLFHRMNVENIHPEVDQLWDRLLLTIVTLSGSSTKHTALRATALSTLANLPARFTKNVKPAIQENILLCLSSAQNAIAFSAQELLSRYLYHLQSDSDSNYFKRVGVLLLKKLSQCVSNAAQLRISATLVCYCDCIQLPPAQSLLRERNNLLFINLFTQLDEQMNANLAEKISVNYIRCLGYFACAVDASILFLNIRDASIIETILQRLLVSLNTTSQNVKTQWNACFSISKILENQCIYRREIEPILKETFTRLGNSVLYSSNFKIRISATKALCVPNTASQYVGMLDSLIKVVACALENEHQHSDFIEYCYQPKLQTQLNLALEHLHCKQQTPNKE